MYPMAPSVLFTIWATPVLPLPAWVSVGHWTVDPASSVHTPGAAAFRYLVKFSVVPGESDRWATVIGLLGSLAPAFRSLMAWSSQVLIWRWKILAMVGASSFSLSTPPRL